MAVLDHAEISAGIYGTPIKSLISKHYKVNKMRHETIKSGSLMHPTPQVKSEAPDGDDRLVGRAVRRSLSTQKIRVQLRVSAPDGDRYD